MPITFLTDYKPSLSSPISTTRVARSSSFIPTIEVVVSYILSAYAQNVSFSEFCRTFTSLCFIGRQRIVKIQGKWRYTQFTLSEFLSKNSCAVGWNFLQNGHSKSEYSIKVIVASLSPLTWSFFSFTGEHFCLFSRCLFLIFCCFYLCFVLLCNVGFYSLFYGFWLTPTSEEGETFDFPICNPRNIREPEIAKVANTIEKMSGVLVFS